MVIFGANWVEILAWNLRQAAALWAAWGGGAATLMTGIVRLVAPIDTDASLTPGLAVGLGDDVEEIEEAPPQRHLKLVD